jgi:predicted MFS family arabinose efflux permease
MAAFESILSLGLACAFLLAGPVLEALGPRVVYRLGGASALIAAGMLLPLRRLGREAVRPERIEPTPEPALELLPVERVS